MKGLAAHFICHSDFVERIAGDQPAKELGVSHDDVRQKLGLGKNVEGELLKGRMKMKIPEPANGKSLFEEPLQIREGSLGLCGLSELALEQPEVRAERDSGLKHARLQCLELHRNGAIPTPMFGTIVHARHT